MGPWEDTNDCLLVPDSANNNTFDKPASDFFYRRCQELGVRLVVVSRYAAYAAKVPRSCYDDLASSGSWIGCRLRNAQRASIEQLWRRAASPPGSADRRGLPARCDRAWFLKTFCGGNDGALRGPSDSIWDLVVGFMQYDTLALLAAFPHLRSKHFKPITVNGLLGVPHLVIGPTEAEHGVLDSNVLSEELRAGYTEGLAFNNRRKVQFILMVQFCGVSVVISSSQCS